MSKGEERAQRKAARQAKFESSKSALLARMGAAKVPKMIAVDIDAGPRLAPHLQRLAAQNVNLEQVPKAIKDGSRFSMRVTWCTSKSDLEGEWSWAEPRSWTADEWSQEINPSMTNFSQLTWREIDQFSSESGHKMHHGHEVCDICDEAQVRWLALGLEEFDSVFRFRLGGKRRIWGFIVQGHFHTIWWDRVHAIYPV